MRVDSYESKSGVQGAKLIKDGQEVGWVEHDGQTVGVTWVSVDGLLPSTFFSVVSEVFSIDSQAIEVDVLQSDGEAFEVGISQLEGLELTRAKVDKQGDIDPMDVCVVGLRNEGRYFVWQRSLNGRDIEVGLDTKAHDDRLVDIISQTVSETALESQIGQKLLSLV